MQIYTSPASTLHLTELVGAVASDMAEPFHCAYSFDSLVAHFERRKPIPLDRVQHVYNIMRKELELDATISLDGQVLLVRGKPLAEPQQVETMSPTKLPDSPLFVTWNKESSSHKLRGCIGTFEPQHLESGLQQYALTAYVHLAPCVVVNICELIAACRALEDTRFNPIRARDLPELTCAVSILTDFEAVEDPMDWELGVHGLRVSFIYHGRRLGATYLPDVPTEQGWTKEETLISLMRKAGWSGKSTEWRKVDLHVTRYKGTKASLTWGDYQKVYARCLSIDVPN